MLKKGVIMDQIYCTLFDSNYLDKGLVLYYSMCKHIKEFKLYVFTFDDLCYKILANENLDHLTIIPLSDFETPELLKVKKERTTAEYCWTCTPWTIKYVIEHYNEDICTYIDADMMFFSSPQPVFDDMHNNNCSIIIVPHRYSSGEQEKVLGEKYGIYCVEFNTFVNDSNGMDALNWWADSCMEWCFYAVPGTTQWYGDQKYLNVFPKKFKGVYICNNLGVGLAPWNCARVSLHSCQNGAVTIKPNETGELVPLVIYHFVQVSFLTKHILNTCSGIKSKSLYKSIYRYYVYEIMAQRAYIENSYGLVLRREHRVVTEKWLMRMYQKYVRPIRSIQHFYELYWVKR